MTLTYKIVCVCISSCSIDKKIVHSCFSIDKIKDKETAPHIVVFPLTIGNIPIIFFGLIPVNVIMFQFLSYGLIIAFTRVRIGILKNKTAFVSFICKWYCTNPTNIYSVYLVYLIAFVIHDLWTTKLYYLCMILKY